MRNGQLQCCKNMYKGEIVMNFRRKKGDGPQTNGMPCQRRRVWLWVLAVLLTAVLIAGIGWVMLRRSIPGMRRSDGQDTQTSFIRTVTLTRGTLDNVISATGTVGSANVSTVTSAMQNGTISEVTVQVGDKVNAGDIIARLDTSSLEEQIEKQKEQLQKAVDTAQKNADAAQNAADEAYDAAVAQEGVLNAAQTAAAAAEKAFAEAKNTVAALQKIFDTADSAAQAAGSAYAAAMNSCAVHGAAACSCADAYTVYEAAKTACAACIPAENAEPAPVCECADELAAYESARADCGVHGSAVCSCAERGSVYESTKAALNTAQSNLKTAKAACNYDALQIAADQSSAATGAARTRLNELEKAYSQALDKLETAKEQLETASESDALEQLEEQLEGCILTAATSGTVTALNATVGSTAQGSIATVQDTEDLTVSFTISDYDYGSVALGQWVRITSDATDSPITGRVSMLSPIAGQSGSFAAECTVEGGANGLYIGMSVNLEIVLSSVEDVYTVPYDAVGTGENGRSVIYALVSGEGTDAAFAPVTVTTGAENDYYIEISGEDLYEGMVIRAAADENEALTTLPEAAAAEDENSPFDFGGMTGMPGGDFGGGTPGENRPSGGDFGGQRPSGGNMPSGGGFGG